MSGFLLLFLTTSLMMMISNHHNSFVFWGSEKSRFLYSPSKGWEINTWNQQWFEELSWAEVHLIPSFFPWSQSSLSSSDRWIRPHVSAVLFGPSLTLVLQLSWVKGEIDFGWRMWHKKREENRNNTIDIWGRKETKFLGPYHFSEAYCLCIRFSDLMTLSPSSVL